MGSLLLWRSKASAYKLVEPRPLAPTHLHVAFNTLCPWRMELELEARFPRRSASCSRAGGPAAVSMGQRTPSGGPVTCAWP